MDSSAPCRHLRAGKVLHDNSVSACVLAFFPLAAATCFSSIPPWFFLPIPTAHAHTVSYGVRRAYRFATHFALCIVVSHPNSFPFWSFIPSLDHQLSSVYFIGHSHCSLFFSISRFMSTIHSPHFFYFTHRLLFFRAVIVLPLSQGFIYVFLSFSFTVTSLADIHPSHHVSIKTYFSPVFF